MIQCKTYAEVVKQDTLVWCKDSGFYFVRTLGDGKGFNPGGPTLWSTESAIEGNCATLQGIVFDLAAEVCPGVTHFYVWEKGKEWYL